MGMMAPDAPMDPYAEPNKYITKQKQYKVGTFVKPKMIAEGKGETRQGTTASFGEIGKNNQAAFDVVASNTPGAIEITDSYYKQKGNAGRDGGSAAPKMAYDYEQVVNPAWDAWFADNLSRKPKTKAKDVQSGGGSGRPSNRKRAGSGTILTDPLGASTVLGG